VLVHVSTARRARPGECSSAAVRRRGLRAQAARSRTYDCTRCSTTCAANFDDVRRELRTGIHPVQFVRCAAEPAACLARRRRPGHQGQLLFPKTGQLSPSAVVELRRPHQVGAGVAHLHRADRPSRPREQRTALQRVVTTCLWSHTQRVVPCGAQWASGQRPAAVSPTPQDRSGRSPVEVNTR